MHSQFAYAAVGRSSNGEASGGNLAYAVLAVDGTTHERYGHAVRSAPIFAPLNQEKERRPFPGSGPSGRVMPRCAAVVAPSIRETFARTGAVVCDGAMSSNVCLARHTPPEIEAKILAGDGGVVYSDSNAGWRRVFRHAIGTSRRQHQEAGLVQDGEERLRVRARLRFAPFHSECGLQRGAMALHDVKDGTRAVLDVVKM